MQTMTERGWRINPIDLMTLVAVGTLAGLTIVLRRRLGEDASWLLGIFATLLIANVFVIWLGRWGRWLRAVHDYFPIITVIVVFSTLAPLIDAVRPERWDAYFAQLDAVLFPGLVEGWRQLLGRPGWFTDLVYVAYVAYYPMPVALAVILYRPPHPRESFDELVFTVALTFLASYVGYFLFPTYGPRVPLESEGHVLGGGVISEGIRAFIHVAERTKTDAFPSGHTAVALVCLHYARRCGRWMTATYVVLTAGVVLATVYLYYHYVCDVLAGAALAGMCLAAGPRLMVWMEPPAWQRFAQEVAGRWRALSPKP